MKTSKTLFLAFIILLVKQLTFAQGQDNVWVFGAGAAIDFGGGFPAPFTPPNNTYLFFEGAASISDASGNLLLFTEGYNIYNRNFNIMPNGNMVMPSTTASTTQGAVIVPKPGSDKIYYVFSLESRGDPDGKLCYSVVDMTLDGGNGDVVPGQKGVEIRQGLGEKMTIVQDGCDRVWLMVRARAANEYLAYAITASGISTTPVISAVGGGLLSSYSAGTILFSPDGKRMAAALTAASFNNPNFLELYDFDAASGILSNPVILDNSRYYYSVCFSPDGKKLYAYSPDVAQYDLSLTGTSAVIASRVDLANVMAGGDMRLGPDGKIYMASFSNSTLHRIEFPNLAGTACQFIMDALTLPWPAMSNLGLPNTVFTKSPDASSVPITSTTEVVTCDTAILQSKIIASGYEWNTGETSEQIRKTIPGIYWVKYTASCKTYVDTFNVSLTDKPALSLGEDTTLCSGDRLQLKLSIPSPFIIDWSTGVKGREIAVTQAGTYWATASIPGCSVTDTVLVKEKSCDCYAEIPNAFSPNGDGLNDYFRPSINGTCTTVKEYTLYIYNRYGQRVFASTNPGEGWSGQFHNNNADIGAYHFELSFYTGHDNKKKYYKGGFTLIR